MTGNPPNLLKAVEAVFDRADAAGWEGVRADTHTPTESGHGRPEARAVTVMYNPVGRPADWPGVAAVVRVGRERAIGDASTLTGQHDLTSHPGPAAASGDPARSHRPIENGRHGVLDVAFREDERRTRDATGGANLALLRRVAVSRPKRATTKGSMPARRLKAAWDDAFLPFVLQGVPAVSGSA